ncbi:hypothetical protein SY88_19615 [Clostridiales bacterium PH28_bin88]|nr:hypothetical protein SY88_19615 [Clostridiales bacterium PH28_bin88]
MFKGMHPIFWIGIAILYGFTFLFMIIEMNVPGFVYGAKLFGAPAQFYYGNIFMMLIVNLTIAVLWFYFPEKAEEQKLTVQKGVTKDAN